MVYFWQKPSAHDRRRRGASNSKVKAKASSVFSPLISAATTAAETALAPVMTANKSEKKSSSSSSSSSRQQQQQVLQDINNAFDLETMTSIGATRTLSITTARTTTAEVGGRSHHGLLHAGHGGLLLGGGVECGGFGRAGEGTSNDVINNNINNNNNNINIIINNNNNNNNNNSGNTNNNLREGASSPSDCRPSSGVVTSKIQTLVLDKLAEYARRKQESSRRRVAERELDSLNLKIDKLLSKMDDGDVGCHGKLRLEEECVVCLAAPATMKTFPCGHCVVCRKCLIKTMQVAISQRCLPLRCVICRNRILSLQHSQDPEKGGSVCCAEESSNGKNHGNNTNISSHGCSSKISRSYTAPFISTSTPSNTSISSPLSPVSQQALITNRNHSHVSGFQKPSTSQGHASTGLFHRYHHVVPMQVHTVPDSIPHSKSSSKPVKCLLGAR